MTAARKTVAVVGAAGFVGSQIAKAVSESAQYQLTPVHRGDPAQDLFKKADIIVHAANPARRFQAEKDPLRDFEETVEKTAQIIEWAKGKRLVMISSLSCRTQMQINYGRHRRACELLAQNANSWIVRLGPMFGGNRTKDSLHDILAHRQVYVSAETRYAYVDVAWAGRYVVNHLEGPTGIQEIGAQGSVRLGDLAKHFNSKSEFTGPDDTQLPENFSDGPVASLIFDYAQAELSRIQDWNQP